MTLSPLIPCMDGNLVLHSWLQMWNITWTSLPSCKCRAALQPIFPSLLRRHAGSFILHQRAAFLPDQSLFYWLDGRWQSCSHTTSTSSDRFSCRCSDFTTPQRDTYDAMYTVRLLVEPWGLIYTVMLSWCQFGCKLSKCLAAERANWLSRDWTTWVSSCTWNTNLRQIISC